LLGVRVKTNTPAESSTNTSQLRLDENHGQADGRATAEEMALNPIGQPTTMTNYYSKFATKILSGFNYASFHIAILPVMDGATKNILTGSKLLQRSFISSSG